MWEPKFHEAAEELDGEDDGDDRVSDNSGMEMDLDSQCFSVIDFKRKINLSNLILKMLTNHQNANKINC